MSIHKELFMCNWAVLSPRHNKAVSRKQQQESRAEKRRNLFQQARNIPLSPKFDDFKVKAAASSTPMRTKSLHLFNRTNTDKENCNVVKCQTELFASAGIDPRKTEQKLERWEVHKQRFLAWKEEKLKAKELEKQKTKPPFIPVGKPKNNIQPTEQYVSFAPKGHVFHPPAGLKDPTVVDVRETSIYVAVPTPKGKSTKKQKPLTTEEHNFKPKSEQKLLKLKKRILPLETKPKEITKQNKPTKNASNLPVVTCIKVTNATNDNIKSGQEKPPLTPGNHASKSTKRPKPGSKNTIEKQAPTLTCATATSAISKANIQPSKPVQPTKAASKTEVKGAKTSSVLKSENKNVKTTGAVGKATAMYQRKQNTKTTNDEKRNNPKPRLAANLKAKKPTGNLNSKVNADIKRNNKKLTTCLKELSENIVSTVTPMDTGISDKAIAFVTSTQTKTTSTTAKSSLDFPDLDNSISPIEPIQTESSNMNVEQHTSAKRALLLETKEKKGTKARKFNFLKQVDIDVTIVNSPTIAPINKEAVVREKSPERKDLPDSTGTLNAQKIQQQPKQSKILSRVFQKLQLKIPEKAAKTQTPQKTQLTPRRSLKAESSKESQKATKNKKFNFLKQIELDETPQKKTEKDTTFNKTLVTENQTETPKEKNSIAERPTNYVSPFVSVSRGKVSARKEKEKRNSIYLQETPRKSVATTSPPETPIEKRRALEAVRYFRQQLNDEIQRLHELCDQWNAYKEEKLELLQANSGEDMINVTIGQTRLLTSKKFMQFSGLIDRCEAHANGTAPVNDGSENTKAITPVDLEGFWSMLGLQVENVGKRFQNLERWKENDWEDPDAVKLKPRIKNNLTKVKKAKTTAPVNGTSKPRVNTALREMMRQKMAEMRSKNKMGTNNSESIESQEVNFHTKEHTPTTSPRRLRRSTQGNSTSRNSLSNTSGRINIVVPDRKSRSLARTVISVPSPVRSSPLKLTTSIATLHRELKNIQDVCDRNELLKAAVLGNTRRSRSLQSRKIKNTPTPVKVQTINSPPHTPVTAVLAQNGRKSILKTPGTARNQLKNVVFNNHLSVKKFRALKFRNEHQETEYDDVQEVHIDDFSKMKSSPVPAQSEEDAESENERSYRLRNRRIKLRPSCEIELPKRTS